MPVDLTHRRLGPAGASNFLSVPGDHHDLVIGLVNFMPLPAMRRTEQEFLALLQTKPDDVNIHFRSFAFYDSTESGAAEQYQGLTYEPLEALWDARIDGLIVTGTEPKATSMADEPLFPLLQELVGWCRDNTKSAIFSCFAAHAAVWSMDRIPRVRLKEKLSGLYECQKCSDNPIIAEMPPTWRTPHSRHNTLNETELQDAGYTILSHAPRLGADTFLKRHGDSQFMFWQGHPEYGPEVLLSEYCRDMRRFISGASTRLPNWPEQYLEDLKREVTTALGQAAGAEAEMGVLTKINALALPHFDHSWGGAASRMAGDWLRLLRQLKEGAMELKS